MYSEFPEIWWLRYELPECRPPPEERCRRLAKRCRWWLDRPDFNLIVAVTTDEKEELMGAAGWHSPVGRDKDYFVANTLLKAEMERRNIREQAGWTHEEEDELWSAVDVAEWDRGLIECDDIRKELMKDEPHW